MILIDNMDMPKNCGECRFMYTDNGELNNGEEVLVYMCSARSQGTAELEYDGKRAKYCPLHEVTDPDTVSRQAVINTVNNMRQACDTENIDDYRELMLEAVKALSPSPTPSRPHGRIYCKDCCYYDGRSYYTYNDISVTGDEGFCSHAEQYKEGGAV